MPSHAKDFAFVPVCQFRRNLAPEVETFHIRMETVELQPSGRQDDSLARLNLNPASIVVDLDAALQNRDEKIHILPSWAVPTARQVDGSSKHVEIVSARFRAMEVFRFWKGADRL